MGDVNKAPLFQGVLCMHRSVKPELTDLNCLDTAEVVLQGECMMLFENQQEKDKNQTKKKLQSKQQTTVESRNKYQIPFRCIEATVDNTIF